jgi:hypothetical protein
MKIEDYLIDYPIAELLPNIEVFPTYAKDPLLIVFLIT